MDGLTEGMTALSNQAFDAATTLNLYSEDDRRLLMAVPPAALRTRWCGFLRQMPTNSAWRRGFFTVLHRPHGHRLCPRQAVSGRHH